MTETEKQLAEAAREVVRSVDDAIEGGASLFEPDLTALRAALTCYDAEAEVRAAEDRLVKVAIDWYLDRAGTGSPLTMACAQLLDARQAAKRGGRRNHDRG